jgi:hypothetical protein
MTPPGARNNEKMKVGRLTDLWGRGILHSLAPIRVFFWEGQREIRRLPSTAATPTNSTAAKLSHNTNMLNQLS